MPGQVLLTSSPEERKLEVFTGHKLKMEEAGFGCGIAKWHCGFEF